MRFAWRAIDRNAIIKSNSEFSVRAFSSQLFGFMFCSSLAASLPPPPHDYGNATLTFMKFYVTESASELD